MTKWSARHPLFATALGTVLALGAAFVIAEIIGLNEVGRAVSGVHPVWIAVAVGAQLVAFPAYAATYREIVCATTGARLNARLLLELVIIGFGPFALTGGFDLDRRALQRIGAERDEAVSTVLGLGGVEFLALVWMAFVAAVIAVLWDPSLPGGFVWPWVIAVPVGTAIAVALGRLSEPHGDSRLKSLFARLHRSLRDVLGLARHPLREWGIWTPIVIYWIVDMLTLYATLRLFGSRPAPEALVLAYGTGYLLSQRTLPLGGAGFVTILLTFALYWMHEPVGAALVGVAAYRAISYVLANLPAFVARRRLRTAWEIDSSSGRGGTEPSGADPQHSAA